MGFSPETPKTLPVMTRIERMTSDLYWKPDEEDRESVPRACLHLVCNSTAPAVVVQALWWTLRAAEQIPPRYSRPHPTTRKNKTQKQEARVLGAPAPKKARASLTRVRNDGLEGIEL